MSLFTSPAYSIGNSRRQKTEQKKDVPGPGTYNVHNEIIQQHKPTWKIGKSIRDALLKNENPGPGHYQVENLNKVKCYSIQEKQGVSIKSRYYESKTDEIPGPGTYEPHYEKIKKSQPSFKLPIEKKLTQLSKPSNIPGPGSYDLSTVALLNIKNGIKFGGQKRENLSISKDLPGPGQYYDQKVNKNIFASMPKFSFGSSQRKTIQLLQNTPGPGTYQNKSNFQNQIFNKKGYSITSKAKQVLDRTKQNPGPGSYEIHQTNNVIKHTPSYSIGNFGKNHIIKISDTPGPMDYMPDILNKKSKSIVIGTSKRSTIQNLNNIPGPGTYDKKNVIGNEGPKFSITRSKSQDKNIEVPGPGQYNPPIMKQKKVSIGIGKEARITQIKSLGPGPGGYFLNELEKLKGYSIGNQKRQLFKKSLTPGPGQYQIKQTIANLPRYGKQ